MIPLHISLEHREGVTVLSNCFIDNYMKDANDAQIKVYLYLLRMVSANLPTDIMEIADKFNHTEKEVVRALCYWEKLNLLSIDYDSQKNIVGVRLCNPIGMDNFTPVAEKETEIVDFKMHAAAALSTDAIHSKPINTMDYDKEKNSYSLDALAAFKNSPESKQLLFAAKQYLKRTISGPEIKTLLFIYDRLGFGLDLTDYLLQYCVGNGQTTMSTIEKTAIRWFEANVKNMEQAKTFEQQANISVSKVSADIMRLLGKQTLPAPKEAEYINRWVKEQAFPMELIEEACNRTVLSVDRNRFAYANSILEAWKRSDIHSLSDLQNLESKRKNQSKNEQHSGTGTTTGSSGSKGAFCNIEQHDYDFAALEKALVSN